MDHKVVVLISKASENSRGYGFKISSQYLEVILKRFIHVIIQCVGTEKLHTLERIIKHS